MNIKKVSIIALWFAGLMVSKLFKLSFAWGSHKFMFSGFLAVAPLLGSILAPLGSITVLASYFGLKYLIGGTALTFGIPTLFATLSWSSNNSKNYILSFALNLLVPLSCMALFATHPTGEIAFAYSLYWLIPVALWTLDRLNVLRGTFSIALQSSFVAHAVGSVMWLYILGMPATKWLSLIPLVAVERLVFAGAATLLYYGATKVAPHFAALAFKRALKN